MIHMETQPLRVIGKMGDILLHSSLHYNASRSRMYCRDVQHIAVFTYTEIYTYSTFNK